MALIYEGMNYVFASRMPLCCASLEQTKTLSSLGVHWGGEERSPGKGWVSHGQTGVFFSFEIQDWLLPRQVLAHPTAKKEWEHGGGEGWEGEGDQKTTVYPFFYCASPVRKEEFITHIHASGFSKAVFSCISYFQGSNVYAFCLQQ